MIQKHDIKYNRIKYTILFAIFYSNASLYEHET